MAFRFTFKFNEKPIETAWYDEPAQMSAPMLIGQLRTIFPDAEISIERGNVLNAKSPDTTQAAKDFQALKT